MTKLVLAAVAITTAMIFVGPTVPSAGALAAADSKPCSTPSHRQFDFWIGTWTVTQAGKVAGRNEIKSIAGNCALLESWTGTGGVAGHSLNIYDTTRDVWHQTWVDSSGALLTLEGRFADGAMVLQGSAIAEKGAAPAQQRITWTPRADGTVRQLWESSSDDGRTWKTEFDGIYKRAP